MRHKTNEFLRRLQLARPEVKKNFRRVGGNAIGMILQFDFSMKYSILGDGATGME